ncbi:MAG TPA: FtsX-like permease family protein [Thermoanaerobaculia bacterium]|nr:FtsX-like permease family protein [Thermoanaerobaculia bacterium]
MKFSRLILKNLFRNKLRAGLTVALMASIFFFVATLLSILDNFEQAANAGEGKNRLGVQSAISLADMLPYAHEEKIRRIEGITETSKLQWVGAYYKEQKNFFANFAVDADKMERVWDDYRVPDDQRAAFKQDRQGTIVGPGLAERFGWKIGDRIVLTGTIFPFNPELNVRGIYEHAVDSASLFFQMAYFEQALGDPGQVGMFWVKVADADRMASVSEEIDALFRNSEYPTETFTEKEFQQQFISMIGNIKLLFTTVSLCAIFMIVLLGAITMSMSARERVTEIAVLRAIGYSRGAILGLMLTEFVLLALLGGAAGAFGANVFYRFIDMTKLTQGFLVNFGVSGPTILLCVAAALGVGLLSGGLPATRSANLSVVDGLRKVV